MREQGSVAEGGEHKMSGRRGFRTYHPRGHVSKASMIAKGVREDQIERVLG